MSFFSSLQQVVSEVTSSVSNLGLSPRRFSFSRESSQGSQGSQKSSASHDEFGTSSRTGSLHARYSRGGRLGPKCVPAPGISGGNPHPGRGRGRKQSCLPPVIQQGGPPPVAKEKERKPLPVLNCGDRFTFWPEYDPSQTWVSEADNHWLEQFTSLGWNHNEALKSLKTATSRQSSRDIPSDVFGPRIQGPGLLKDELDALYGEVLYTVFHQVGVPSDAEGKSSPEDLVRYAQMAFHIDNLDHTRLQAVVYEEKPPIVVLNLVVVEAEGLEAKDPNGFSDPYCMMGIIMPGPAKVPPTPSPSAGNPSLSATASFIAAATAFAGSRPSSRCSNHSTESFSDPYCMLGIQPTSVNLTPHQQSSPPPDSPRIRGQGSRNSQDTESESDGDRSGSCESPRAHSKDNLRKHHSFRLSFKRRGDSRTSREHRDSLGNAIPARIIRATSVRPQTLNPKWNEKFRLDIDDINTDILHLDIWDHDDETSVFDMVSKLNEVKGVKGLGRFFKQIAQSGRSAGGQDDFLGSVNVPLQDVPSTGLDKRFSLEGRSQRSNIQGQIHLKMWLSTREDRGRNEDSSWTEVKQHDQIIGVFALHELSKWKDDSLSWDGNLNSAAEAILHQHALQGDLTPLQQAICRWQAYTRTHISGYALDHRILQRKLIALHELWNQEALNKIEEEMLGESFQQFVERSLEEIRKHKELFPMPSKTHVFRLDALFRCLLLMNESRVYWKVCPFHKEIRGEILVALRRAAHDRYAALREVRPKGLRQSAVIEAFVRVVNQLTLDLQVGLDFYEHVTISTMKIPYVSLMYKVYEKLVTEDAVNALESIQTNEDSESESWRLCQLIRELDLSKDIPASTLDAPVTPFLLYLALAELSRFQEQVPVPERRSLVLSAVWPHFYPSVNLWLDVASWKLLCRVRTAILSDRVANTGEPVQYTTSAVDTTSCLYHVKTFWRHLAWPDSVSGYSLVVKLIQAMSLCTDYFVGLLQQRLMTLPSDVPNDKKAQQLCITVNNMEHVRHSFTLVYEELQLEEFGKILEAQDPRNGRSCSDHITTLLHTALVSLHDRITDSMMPVAEKMRVELRRDVFHLAWSPDSLPAEDAVRPLLEHLHTALTQFSLALLKNNLDRLLALLWHDVLVALIDQIGKDNEEKQSVFFIRLYNALELLKEFFYANGKGLDVTILQGYDYLSVENQLRLHKTSTRELIESYHLERLNEQESNQSQEFGVIFVRVYFNHDSLCVEVLQAKNVIPLDPNGLSDPFVVVELLPRRLFPESSPQHTNVHKKTLNPMFDECFEFPATLESCQSEEAMILFTLMDHDVITCNDFGGEAFLSLNHIPGVASSATLQNFHGLKPIELHLMFRKDPDNLTLKVLETRTNDKVAQEFFKKQKQRIKL